MRVGTDNSRTPRPPAPSVSRAGGGELPYTSAAAFRAALKARFTAIAKKDSRYTVNELQRQFAYDRILSRCFSAEESDRWVLKGAGALLARLSVARHSKDIDLYYAGLSAYLGGLYANFHVDVVVGTPMSGQPDRLPPLTPLQIDGLLRPDYRAFPLPDHCADKLCAVIETHEQTGGTRVSSRVKDLVDLALIARSQTIDGAALRAAILAGTGHRGLPIPAVFAVPDWEIWRAGFTKAMAAAPGESMAFTDALDLVKRFLDPVLAGPVAGHMGPAVSPLGAPLGWPRLNRIGT